MSQNQQPAPQGSEPITADLAQLACTWKAIPIASALMEVGVPELIPIDGSDVDVAKLAQQAKVDADLLYRYMRFVSALGIFKELPNRHFAHTESSKLLLRGTRIYYQLLFWGSARSGSLAATAEYATQLRDPSKSALEHALKMSFWQRIAQTPELEKEFAESMIYGSNLVMQGILQNIKLPESGIVADIGGGHGHALLEFIKANSKLTGILYDMPAVAKLAEEGLRNQHPSNDSIYAKYPPDVKQRVSTVSGSYTDVDQLKQIANADVFFFKWIFHDNNDAVCSNILAAFYQIMKPTAEIIICDCVFENTLNRWKLPLALDLTMAEQLNGKERSVDQWTQLLNKGEGYEYIVSFGNFKLEELLETGLIILTKK